MALLIMPMLVWIFGKCFGVAHRWFTSSAAADAFFTHSNAIKTVSLSEVKAMIAVANAPAATDMFAELLATHGLDEALCRAELRRFADQNPGTPEVAGALAAIERIKAAFL